MGKELTGADENRSLINISGLTGIPQTMANAALDSQEDSCGRTKRALAYAILARIVPRPQELPWLSPAPSIRR